MRYTLIERPSRCSADDGNRKRDEEAVTSLFVDHVQSSRVYSTLVVDWTAEIQEGVGNHANGCMTRLFQHYAVRGKAKPPTYHRRAHTVVPPWASELSFLCSEGWPVTNLEAACQPTRHGTQRSSIHPLEWRLSARAAALLLPSRVSLLRLPLRLSVNPKTNPGKHMAAL
jgi:hypothetical protein